MARIELNLAGADRETLMKLKREWRGTVARWRRALAALEYCAVIFRDEGKLLPPYSHLTAEQFYGLVSENRDEMRFAERQLARVEERLR